jgi:hypothetical protein
MFSPFDLSSETNEAFVPFQTIIHRHLHPITSIIRELSIVALQQAEEGGTAQARLPIDGVNRRHASAVREL